MTLRNVVPLWTFLFAVSLLVQGTAAVADVRKNYKCSIEHYTVPDVTLVNQNGKKVRLNELLNANDTVMVDFIFTTCTTVCPLLSIGFSDLQKKLGPESKKVQLVSISIDPEHDTPKLMKAYLKRYGAQPGWDYLTGNREDIDKVLRVFSAYSANKMSHVPLILMRSRSGTDWVRISGIIRTADLIEEYRRVPR